MNVMKTFFCAILLFFGINDLCADFTAGTLVKTEYGYTAIENLKIGDNIVSFDAINKCISTSRVTNIQQRYVSDIRSIRVKDTVFSVAREQLFLSSVDYELWLDVKDIDSFCDGYNYVAI